MNGVSFMKSFMFEYFNKFISYTGSHRDMMRVAEIIVAFVFRSTRRVDSPLNEISDFLSCDTIAVAFNGCDSEKRTF